MNVDLVITLAVTGLAVVLFASERLQLSLVAMMVLSILLLSGVIGVEEAFSGFSNPATVTVGAMFVLSAGLYRAGAVNAIGGWMTSLLGRQFALGLAVLMAGTAVLSAFINNTAVVAILLPIVIHSARDANVSASRLLIPLSFASMFGGSSTLIGTSTNLLVSSVAGDYGQEPIGMFELAPLGIVFTLIGIAYMLLIGRRLLPERPEARDLTDRYAVDIYVSDILLEPGAPSVGRKLREAPLLADLECTVLAIFRGEQEWSRPSPDTILKEGDILRLRCGIEEISKIRERERVRLASPANPRDLPLESVLVEAVIAPGATFEGNKVGEAQLVGDYGAAVLGIRHRGGDLTRERIGEVRIRGGDALLLEIDPERILELRRSNNFVVVSELSSERFRRDRIPVAVAILAAVVLTAALGIMPIVATASAGGLLMVLTGCLRHDEALEAIDWNVIFLLAGILPLGLAMENTGAAELLGHGLVHGLGQLGPTAVLSGAYLLTVTLTAFVSNNGTAVLLTPVAASAALELGVDPRPMVMAVAFGASTAFATPIGYQTNTLVYGAGDYRFSEFVKVGAPLTVIFWLVATALIPVFWPL